MTEKTPIELPTGTVLFQNERFRFVEYPSETFMIESGIAVGQVETDGSYVPPSPEMSLVDMAKSLSYIRGRGLEINQVIVAPAESGEIKGLIVLAQTPQVRKDNS